MWTACVCAGQPGTSPIDDGHPPAQYSCSIEKVAWNTIGCGQSRAGSKYSTSAGCCTNKRPQKAKATGLETTTSSSDFGAMRRYARYSAARLVPCTTFSLMYQPRYVYSSGQFPVSAQCQGCFTRQPSSDSHSHVDFTPYPYSSHWPTVKYLCIFALYICIFINFLFA